MATYGTVPQAINPYSRRQYYYRFIKMSDNDQSPDNNIMPEDVIVELRTDDDGTLYAKVLRPYIYVP